MKNKRLNGNTKHKHASSIFSHFLSMTGFNRVFDTFFHLWSSLREFSIQCFLAETKVSESGRRFVKIATCHCICDFWYFDWLGIFVTAVFYAHRLKVFQKLIISLAVAFLG